MLTVFTAAAVALAAVLGVLIGHALWKTALSNSSAPFGGNGGGTTTPSITSPTNPSGSNGPSNPAGIANNVDPGLVDINTSINYGQAEGAGTGMVLTSSGEVLTNNHVIEGATSISVTDVGNGKTYSATVLGYDRSHDVAVLQLSAASGLRAVTVGDSSNISIGEGVVAIGNANGVGGTPSYAAGSITATNQSISASDQLSDTSEQLSGLIETNADIISGDSGGPLVNSAGQVLGIDTASSGAGGFQFTSPSNEGFAIPIDQAVTTAKSIEAGSGSSTVHVGPTAFLGVEVTPTSSCSDNPFAGGGSSSSVPGALVCDVVSGGPANEAGLAGGDTITSVDGHPVTSSNTLTDVMVGDEKPNTSVQVRYVDSSGQQQSTTVKLTAGPPQ